MNELHSSSSPYLLQHKDQPVNWKQWNDKNLNLPNNQLLIISIGYSSCHWCHIMAHECFEDKEVANFMNKHFINYKVDREEQPEIDAIYMRAYELMNQNGGWPLNIIALPNGIPIWGCTYLPKKEWLESLNAILLLYQNEKEKVLEYAEKIKHNLNLINRLDILLDKKNNIQESKLYENWIKKFDWQHGGIIGFPKFIIPSHWNFLFQYPIDKKIEKYVKKSLLSLCKYGINDPIEGGFFRYSVDNQWHIPHFEKMLYDQAQIIVLYVQAFLKYQEKEFLHTAVSTTHFVISNWKNQNNGYFAAFDADSLTPKGNTEEGYYYTLTPEEVDSLRDESFSFIKEFWNIYPENIWENQYYHLHQTQEIGYLITKYQLSLSEAEKIISLYKKKIIYIRKKKNKPNTDTKIITSWNAMLLSSMVDLYLIAPTELLLKNIDELYQYLSEKCFNEKENLVHTNSLWHYSPLLEDYAFVIQSFLKYYQIHFDTKALHLAKQLTDTAIDLFFNEQQNFFTSHIKTNIHIVSTISIEDGVIPSANAIMCENLYILSVLYSNNHYLKIAETMLQKVTNNASSLLNYSQWYAIKNKWKHHFKYLIAKNYSNSEIQKIYLHQKDYNLFLIKYSEDLPISKNYSSMQEKEIQMCNTKQCFLKTLEINTFFEK